MFRAILVLLFLAPASCADAGCRDFDGGAVSFCIPSRQVLGSIPGLPPVTESEIGFFIGKNMSDPARITVMLTTHEYACATNPQAPVCSYVDPVESLQPDSNAKPRKRFSAPGLTSMWHYVLIEDEREQVIASCSAVSTRPGFGLCATSGVFGDVHYSARYFDDAHPNPHKVRGEVARWLEAYRKPED